MMCPLSARRIIYKWSNKNIQISWIEETPCIEAQASHNKLHCTPIHT